MTKIYRSKTWRRWLWLYLWPLTRKGRQLHAFRKQIERLLPKE